MSQPVLTSVDKGVFEITLNRPDQLNAFTTEMHALLRTAFERAESDKEIRAVILTGAGRGFCAGQDLSERDPDNGKIVDLSETLNTNYNPLIRRMRALEKPILCAVNGVAAGAGANLALACDIVLAAKSAKFIQAFSKIGLIPDAGGTYTLTRLIGEARAKALAMTAAPLSAEDAADWGLIWRCLPDEDLMVETRKLAQSLESGATVGLGKTKTAIQAASVNSLDEQLNLEAKLQGQLGKTDDFKEGVLAFREKRPANFTGK
ncbi:MAG: 2-(1,2-epoxy-1,2-dihydrophenyl)acetyl-CoA isomerase PaaG [Salaquimonas sp.]